MLQVFMGSTTTSTSTIDQGSKAVLGKSSQENKILTDCSTVDTEGRNRMGFERELLVWVSLQLCAVTVMTLL